MASITQLIKSEIKRQYGSIMKFSKESGIPYSTLSNALTKGVGGTSFDTVVKICKLLNIKQTFDNDIILLNQEFHDIYMMLTALDDRGVHTIKTVLTVEYDRCTGNESVPSIKAFNGIGIAKKDA